MTTDTTIRATGSFHNTGWEEVPVAERDGRKLTRASITQEVHGDLEGAATWITAMAYAADGTARYVGMLRFEGRLDERDGTFIVETDGRFDGAAAETTWAIVDGTGTGAFADMTGTGRSHAPHGPDGTYELTLSRG
ncbi:MAG TPA: DUF3224 domain-containing protein [Candidatus Limnocylindrales bacterium]